MARRKATKMKLHEVMRIMRPFEPARRQPFEVSAGHLQELKHFYIDKAQHELLHYQELHEKHPTHDTYGIIATALGRLIQDMKT